MPVPDRWVSSEKKGVVSGDEARLLENRRCSDVVEEVSDDVAVLDPGLLRLLAWASNSSTLVKV